MSNYIKTPFHISYGSVIQNNFSLSSGLYKDLHMPNPNFLYVRDFLTRRLKKTDLGNEVGTKSYINYSTHFFIRTKALQSYSYIPEITPETALPIMPFEFRQMDLKENDLIISKDGNIGEVVLLDKDYPNYMLSGALYKLPVKENLKYYLLAFLKHGFFKEQLDYIVPKGATLRHAKDLFLNCKIPLPESNENVIIDYITIIVKSIIEKEKLIKKRHDKILNIIEEELRSNQKINNYKYYLPTFTDIENAGRIDASLYSNTYKEKENLIINYKFGYKALTEQNLIFKPGPSLETKLLGTRIDSNIFINGFYKLITPKQISNFGTLKQEFYIGTPLKIESIKYGDILFGESGTGRSLVYLDKDNNTINNAHAHILRPIPGLCSIEHAITIRCILQYYKQNGMIDQLTVGGAGGHLSPSYFNRIILPNFLDSKEQEISILYHNPKAQYQSHGITLQNFQVENDKFNSEAGIYELSSSLKYLKNILNNTIESIINGEEVKINFDNNYLF